MLWSGIKPCTRARLAEEQNWRFATSHDRPSSTSSLLLQSNVTRIGRSKRFSYTSPVAARARVAKRLGSSVRNSPRSRPWQERQRARYQRQEQGQAQHDSWPGKRGQQDCGEGCLSQRCQSRMRLKNAMQSRLARDSGRSARAKEWEANSSFAACYSPRF